MEFFTVLPMRKYLDKQIVISDSDSTKVGFIQRRYKSRLDKVINYLPLSFLETRNIDGEGGGYQLKIREQSFKSNLTKLKWDVYLKDVNKESSFLLRDKTKISTNPRMVYHKNNKEYVFKKDIFNRTCDISIDGHISCAEIKMDKKFPPSLRIKVKTDDLTVAEVLGVYYIINLVY
ncbi:tubby C-terminal domain-like protein [Gracilibacillus caseinilyticus]